MRLIKHVIKAGTLSYTIIEVSAVDLANIQLSLITTGQRELKLNENWQASPPKQMNPSLTINQANWIGDLIYGVQSGLKMRYYPQGSEDADNAVVVTLRAFTYEGGGLYPSDADIRDSFVWTSGFTERWFKVDDLVKALDNAMLNSQGSDMPMAIIDKERS